MLISPSLYIPWGGTNVWLILTLYVEVPCKVPCRVQVSCSSLAEWLAFFRHLPPPALQHWVLQAEQILRSAKNSNASSGIIDNEAVHINQFYTLLTFISLNVKTSYSFYFLPLFFFFLWANAIHFHTQSTAMSHTAVLVGIPATSTSSNHSLAPPLPHYSPSVTASSGPHDLGNKRLCFVVVCFQDSLSLFM